ncbi:MAG: hypothetical protein KDI16_15575 [Halioglobus sp.]|nr:hypothetical protein [Halioglobus sp.]
MNTPIQFGERLFLPVLMAPYARRNDDPLHRRLWVYVLDPASSGSKRLTQCIEVPYEPLGKAGIHGAVFAVDHSPLPPFLLDHLDWPERLIEDFNQHPLHLDEPRLAMAGGIEPCTGKPLFAGQMAYAICQRVYDTFAAALGRFPTWGPWVSRRIRHSQSPALTIRPFAFEGANAYYDPSKGSLEFGVFNAALNDSTSVLPGGMVITCLSHDIIAHEVTHALLDGMRAHFRLNTHPDVPALHEGFADLVALFHHFQYPDLVEQAIEDHGGLNSDMLLELGKEFGTALGNKEGDCLRRAMDNVALPGQQAAPEICNYEDPALTEPHVRGSVLVAAVFAAYLQVYERRAGELLRLANVTAGGESRKILPSQLVSLLAREAAAVADEFLQACIRAIDYCPPLDVRFGDYLRAIITADRMLNPQDSSGMRDALIREFRRRKVDLGRVRDLSEYSLEWNSPSTVDRPAVPGLAWSDLRFRNDGRTPQSIAEIERQAQALGEFLIDKVHSGELKGEFGVTRAGGDYGPITIESLRTAARRGRDGRLLNGIIAETSQTRTTPDGVVRGGSTLVLTEEGRVDFAIRKRVDDEQRLLDLRHQLADTGGLTDVSFRELHSHRR